MRKINKKLILLLGKCGSGRREYIKNNRLHLVIPYSTGRIRNLPYKIVSLKKYTNTPKINIVTSTIINGHRYWTTLESLIGKDIFIGNINTYKQLKKSMGNNYFKVFYIKSRWYKRIYRMLKREMKLREIINQLIYDRKLFKKKCKICE